MNIHTPTADMAMPRHRTPAVIKGQLTDAQAELLTHEALMFLADLQRRFGLTRQTLLQQRKLRQEAYDYGDLPHTLPETEHIRAGQWTIAPIPEELQDRRVEITGPVDRKMMINALNSGAKMFMADLEDASSPTWANMIDGQLNLRDYADGNLSFQDEKSGKSYELNDEIATMIVRPRGWHLEEMHVEVDGAPMSGSLFDFGLHFFTNGRKLLEQKRGPFYYLPKMESHLEARLWNDVFTYAQAMCDVPHGSIKATVLIETLPAAFEMDEILYELRDHAAGLNCGRWDFIFSYIKTLRNHSDYVLPDRAEVGMAEAFLRAYSVKLIEICHRRKAHAMGGMAAQIPVKNDEAANDAAFAKVKADKEREVQLGHDGTWVAHPALVPVAMEVFDKHMPAAHQIHKMQQHPKVSDAALLKPHEGEITEDGVRTNISVGVIYIAAWLGGRGAVPIHNLMEDAATAEISRTQIWQWLRHGAKTADGTSITSDYITQLFKEEMDKIREQIGEEAFTAQHYPLAGDLFLKSATSVDYVDFLTIPAYREMLMIKAN